MRNLRSNKAKSINGNIAQNIKLARQAKNYTQKDIANALRISYQQVQKYEAGSNRISAIDLFILSNFLDIPIDSFFTGNIIQPEENITNIEETDIKHLLTMLKSIKSKKMRKQIIDLCSSIEKSQ